MTKQKNENMKVWESLCETDPRFTKPFNRGNFSGKDINPMYRWQMLTKTFGPAGKGWGVEDYKANMVDLPDGEKMITVSVTGFYTMDGEKHFTPPGFGQDYVVRFTRNGLKSDDEAAKKAMTDALGNAFKYLGLCADVFLKQHDDSKYVNTLMEKYAKEEPEPEPEPQVTEEPPAKDQNDPLKFPDIPDGREHLMHMKDGRPLFIHQTTDESKTDLANLAAWYIMQADKIDSVMQICRDNQPILTGLRTDAGMDPIEQGCCDWASGKLSRTKTLKGISASWSRIGPEVNEVKETIPPLYVGITRAFKERKQEIQKDG